MSLHPFERFRLDRVFPLFQMIEPAVVFIIFSRLIPVAILVALTFGVPEVSLRRNRVESFGLLSVLIGIGYLAAITMLGQSGFVRGTRWSPCLD